ncbi:MAG: ABC transporter permease [Clostridia bacterium]|nr:ABC transporter permease [Clostridia bacterium]
MFALLRDGFVRDVIAAVLVTIIVGSGAVLAVSNGADRFFGRAVSGVLGEDGEYDMVVHVRAEVRREAARAIESDIPRELPGARVKEGVTVLSRSNFLVALPEKNAESFDRLVRVAAEIPGYVGYTVVMEPKITVSGVGPGVAPLITPELEKIDGVLFTVQAGGEIHLVCDSPESAQSAGRTAEALLSRRQVVDIRMAPGSEALLPGSPARSGLLDGIRRGASSGASSGTHHGLSDAEVHDVTPDAAIDDSSRLASTLQKMRGFLETWGPKATEFSSSLDEAEQLLSDFHRAVQGALVAAESSEKALAEYEKALDSLISLQRALERIGVGEPSPLRIDPEAIDSLVELTDKAIAEIARLRETAEAVSLFTTRYDPLMGNLKLWEGRLDSFARKLELIRSAANGAGGVAAVLNDMSTAASGILRTLQELDATGLRHKVEAAREDLSVASAVDVESIAAKVREMRDSIPKLSPDEADGSIQLIDKLVEEQREFVGRLQILVISDVSSKELTKLSRLAAGPSAAASYALPAGVVQPGVRSEVRTLLGSVRSTVAGMTALGITIMSLVFDHAAIISTAAHMGDRRRGRPAPGVAGCLYGATIGGVTLWAISFIAGASVASLGRPALAVVGMATGATVAMMAMRVSPVNADEIEACAALGMNPSAILREVILPAGKPGVISLLNRSQLVFAGSFPDGFVQSIGGVDDEGAVDQTGWEVDTDAQHAPTDALLRPSDSARKLQHGC